MKEADGLPDSNTAELVEQACNRNERAFEMLVERFTPRLKAIARFYLSFDHDIEDVIQEVWIKAYRNLQILEESNRQRTTHQVRDQGVSYKS
jgi:DNA-directed RNA polymerase specialized sigma24 family protein